MSYFMGGFGLFQTGSSFNATSFMSNFLADYASIRNGSYQKLLTAYYKKTPDGDSSSNDAVSNILNKNTDKTLTEVKSDANELVDSANALVTKGKDSLFNEKDITTTDKTTGETVTTKGVDREGITKAVKSFVSDYNSLIESGAKTSNTDILRKTLMMTQNTAAYRKSLENVGITIGKDNKLSVDDEKLKSADISDVKTLFNGTTSFASRTSQRASMMAQSATNAATKAFTYNNSGKYQNYNYFGSSFNEYF